MSRAPDFTLARYGELLAVAREEGYAFVRFGELESAPARAIVLRHDIDYDPRFVAAVSEVEREHGAVATYCFLPGALTYSLDAPQTRAAAEAVIADGHDIGLHFDATDVSDDALPAAVATAAEAMHARFGTRPAVVSWHMAGRRHAGHLKLPGLVNSYAPRFFGEIGYVSDSNRDWRDRDLEAILRAGEHERLQVLTHPIWWRAQPVALIDALRQLAQDSGVDLDAILTPEQRALIGLPAPRAQASAHASRASPSQPSAVRAAGRVHGAGA